MTKTDVIEKVYQDFYGSIKQTYEQAKKIDPTIKYDDIKRYFETTKVRKTNLRGYNSFIAHHFREEYQIDLCFFNENPEDEYKIGLLVIDIFSKFRSNTIRNKAAKRLTGWFNRRYEKHRRQTKNHLF